MSDLSTLHYSSEFPGFIAILITVISSMILGVLLAFTYDKTSREIDRPNHFLQAMVLITIVAATVIQAIGDSVARGLGMIGALSIIRFRTTVRDPRNLVFIFSSIVVGIATGVFGFLIAIVGTVGFCLTAFLLYYSSFSPKDNFIGKIKLEFDPKKADFSVIEAILNEHCSKYQLVMYQSKVREEVELIQYNYKVRLKSNESSQFLLFNLKNEASIISCEYIIKRGSSEGI